MSLCSSDVRGTHHGLGGRAPSEQPAAEGDAAHGEPRPAEGQSSDHVRKPVDVEQHAAARDRYGDCHGSARQKCACRVATAASEQERCGSVESRGRGRVPAREGWAECRGDRVQGRPHPVDEILHGKRQGGVPGDHDDEVRDDPVAPRPQPLDGGEDDCEGDHEPRLAERRHELEAAASRTTSRARHPRPRRCCRFEPGEGSSG